MTKSQETICPVCGWTSKDELGLTHCPECDAALLFMDQDKNLDVEKVDKYPEELVAKSDDVDLADFSK